MRISIFGMGYVGAVSGACFARMGHDVIGVDVNRGKVDMINAGGSPVVEEGLSPLMQEARTAGRISATLDPIEAIRKSDISLISVGTPTGADGTQALGALDSVVASIGEAIRQKPEPHAIIVRSTVMPRTTEDRIFPRLEQAAGRRLGERFTLALTLSSCAKEPRSRISFTHPSLWSVACGKRVVVN